jgi:hypothetical protein
MQNLKRAKVALWTRDRIETLTTLEVRQLQANALRLAEPEIAAVCEQVLDSRPHGHPPERKPKTPGVAAAGARKRART